MAGVYRLEITESEEKLVVPLPKGQRKIAFNRQMLTAPLLRISDYSLPFT